MSRDQSSKLADSLDEVADEERIENRDVVAHSVKSGEYFEHAYDWYCTRYLRCVTDLHYALFFASLMVALLSINAWNIYSILPLASSMPFVKYVDDNPDRMHVIKKVRWSPEESADYSLARYLVSRYVEARERYSYSQIEEQKEYIKNNSSYKVYSEFVNYMSADNAASPMIKYRYSGRKEAKVVSFGLEYGLEGKHSSLARVKFQSTDYDGDISKTTEGLVEVAFTISDVRMNLEGLAPMEFFVNSYTRR